MPKVATMTTQEIDAMQAGRELDALIAEKVMGITIKRRIEYGVVNFYMPREGIKSWRQIPYYSTDIAAAWEVARKIAEKFSDGDMCMRLIFNDGSLGCWVHIESGVYPSSFPHVFCSSISRNSQLAICHVALKAMFGLWEI